MYHIAIVEDNKKIRDELSDFLNKNGYKTSTPHNFENIIDEIKTLKPHLLLLDLNLPMVDGHQICREIRKISTMPIIIVTSRNSDMDELISLNLGADDFISKPYNLQVLLAHLSTVLKRVYESNQEHVLRIGEIALDISKSMITYQDKNIDLTKNELRIMHCLFLNKNKIVSRNELMQHMWDCDLFVDDNTLTVNINRLRKKLDYLRLSDLIQTKRGLGYLLYEDI
ncbi:MAG: response regulator transcription factor [Erysipelotrichaceae bacterium]